MMPRDGGFSNLLALMFTAPRFHREKFCNINDTFKLVIGILVNRLISTVYFDAILVKILVEMCPFTRIPNDSLKRVVTL